MKSGITRGVKRIGSGIVRRIGPLNTFKNKYLDTLVSVKTDKNVAAITFDDGPDPTWTPKILDVLDEFNVKATFFVIGRRADKYPEIVKKAYESGHAIANHTWDHPCLPVLSRKERVGQIEQCQNSISEFDSQLFRPPFGCQSIRSKLDAFHCGYSVVAWSMHVADWEERLASEIEYDLNRKLRPGSIILLHDAQNGRSREEMINGLIAFLKKNNDYQFVTVNDMLNLGEEKKKIWNKKPNKDDLKSHQKRFDTIEI